MGPAEEFYNIIWINSVDSTNNELRRRLPGLPSGTVLAARQQTAGRGQGDHVWLSSPSENLTFSILLRFRESVRLPAKRIGRINDVLCPLIVSYLEGHGITARIKLPNDIWVADRKICGILIENILSGDCVSESIIGIGLNLNQTIWPANLPNPVSIKELTGKTPDPEEELGRFCAAVIPPLVEGLASE